MSQYFPDFPSRTGSARSGSIRIGDAERDEAVSVLSEHFVAGRLTQDEFEDRSDQATRARYSGDLEPLFSDLPDLAAPQQWSPGTRVGPQRSRPGPTPPFVFFLPLLMMVLVLTAITLAGPWILLTLFWVVMASGMFSHARRHRHYGPSHHYHQYRGRR
jgi:DUF1707 SHOCT-like domain